MLHRGSQATRSGPGESRGRLGTIPLTENDRRELLQLAPHLYPHLPVPQAVEQYLAWVEDGLADLNRHRHEHGASSGQASRILYMQPTREETC